MARPKNKNNRRMPNNTPTPRLHRIQEVPIEERDDSPERRWTEESCCTTTLMNICIIMMITFFTIGMYNTWPGLSTECSKAEIVLHNSCVEKIARTLKIVDSTIPDFSMTPIGKNVALKCQEMEDCLNAIDCPALKFKETLPERCALYQFFENDFKRCREKLQRTLNLPPCVSKFMIQGPVDCNTLQEHAECYKDEIGIVCNDETSLFHFWVRRYLDEYSQMIDCQLEYG